MLTEVLVWMSGISMVRNNSPHLHPVQELILSLTYSGLLPEDSRFGIEDRGV